MRPWLLAALVLPALAKKPKDETVDDSAMVASQETSACRPDTPEGYQVHTGYATGEDPAATIAEAQLQARKLAIETLCAGKSESRCAVVRRHVEAWKVPFHNPISLRACAHVGVNREWLDDDTQDQARLAKDLAVLGARVAASLGEEHLLWIEPPLWTTSGCHAGEVGAALTAELRNGLAAAGGVRIAVAAEQAAHLSVGLSTSGDQVVLDAVLHKPGVAGAEPIEGIRFPADLFELGSGGGDCRFDRELGLESGRRLGAGGHLVAIHVPGEGNYCEGDLVEPTLVVNRPSKVRVFSVSRSGMSYLVWPPPGSEGVVTGSLSLGQMELHPSPEGGDEKLLAVAVPADAAMGAMDRWSGFCQVPAFTSALYPSEAAAGAATFQVQRFDADSCLVRDVEGSPVQPIPPAPVCGG